MADTIQIVEWALEWGCRLRPDRRTRTAEAALAAVNRARAYSEGLRNNRDGFGVFGDVFVSTCTAGRRPDWQMGASPPPYPWSGFIISEEFKHLGGPFGLFEMCIPCPANATPHGIAGCCGTLCQWPDSPETESQIRGIITRLGIERRMEAAFPATTPIWYGLWAVSPVPEGSLPLLRMIIAEMLAEDKREMEAGGEINPMQLRYFALFVKAAEQAERYRLPLHVALAPPGHSDLGVYAIFPHCPFCKAATRMERWQRRYPAALYTCHVCGQVYSPVEMASEERVQWNCDELRQILGPKRFVEFAQDYLITLGETPESAAAIVQETESTEEQRKELLRREAELHAKKDEYLAAHIFAGLTPMTPPPGEFQEDELSEIPCRWFDAATFAEVLRRCAAHGIGITLMIHHSADGRLDREQWEGLDDPLAVLREWREEGCNGRFFAGYRVPNRLVV